MTEEVKQTQNNMILEYMRKNGAITRVDALRFCSCANLTARITDLRKHGHDIQTIRTHGVNQFGRNINYGRFILREETA